MGAVGTEEGRVDDARGRGVGAKGTGNPDGGWENGYIESRGRPRVFWGCSVVLRAPMWRVCGWMRNYDPQVGSALFHVVFCPVGSGMCNTVVSRGRG